MLISILFFLYFTWLALGFWLAFNDYLVIKAYLTRILYLNWFRDFKRIELLNALFIVFPVLGLYFIYRRIKKVSRLNREYYCIIEDLRQYKATTYIPNEQFLRRLSEMPIPHEVFTTPSRNLVIDLPQVIKDNNNKITNLIFTLSVSVPTKRIHRQSEMVVIKFPISLKYLLSYNDDNITLKQFHSWLKFGVI